MAEKVKPDAPHERRFCYRCEKYRTDKEWYDCPGWVFTVDVGMYLSDIESTTKPCPEWDDLRPKRLPQ